MAPPTYTKLIWSGMERVKGEKLRILQENYEVVRYLYNRTPKGILAISSSATPVTITAANQVIMTMSVDVTAGRLYKVRVVNNNIIYDNTNAGIISLQKNGTPVRQNTPFYNAATGGPYNTKRFSAPYAMEYLDVCATSEVATYTVTAGWPSSHNYQWKIDSSTITTLDGLGAQFAATNVGKYYLSIEDKGVIDI